MTVDLSAVQIRPEASGEEAAIAELGVRSFDNPLIGRLISALRASDAWIPGLSFVAEYEGRIVGQVLYTRSLLDAPKQLVDVLVLSPLCVESELKGQGIGSKLVRDSLAILQERAEPLVFLEGSWRYYPRFGFVPGGELDFRRPSLRIPEAAFMVKQLPAYESWMTGTLVYSRVFWDLDAVGLRQP